MDPQHCFKYFFKPGRLTMDLQRRRRRRRRYR
jgi:hypothetical protein